MIVITQSLYTSQYVVWINDRIANVMNMIRLSRGVAGRCNRVGGSSSRLLFPSYPLRTIDLNS